MNNNTKALKSGLWYTISNFLTKSIGIITTPIFTRMLSHEEFGLYNNFTSWLAVFTILVTLNLDSTFISARYDYEKRFDEYIFSSLSLSTLSALFWIIIFNVFGDLAVARLGLNRVYINCMMIYLLFLPAVNMFQARERYKYEYKISVLISCVITIGTALVSVLMVLSMSDRLKGRIFGSVIPTIVCGAIIYLYIYRKGKMIKTEYWKYAFPICFPFIPHLLSLTVLNTVDRIMITKICGAEDNALYSLAYTCSSVVTILLTSLNTAFTPWLGEKLHENKIQEINEFSKKYILIFSGLALGIMLISPEIILVLGGKSYLSAMYVMPPVMFGCVCQFLYTMFVNVEQFKKKTIGMAIASVSAAVINYVLNYFMIPKYGYIAAAYTTLISFIWLLFAHMFLVYHLKMNNIYSYKFIFAVVSVSFVITTCLNVLYKHSLLRYLIIVLYGCACIYVIIRCRNQLLKLLKRKTE